MSNKVWSICLIALMFTVAIAAPVSAGDEGTPAVGVQVQNLATAGPDITVFAQSYSQAGTPPEALGSARSVPAGTAVTLYLPDYTNLSAGLSALVISASDLAGGIARTEWTSTGAAIYSTAAPDIQVLLPVVLSNFVNQTSQVTVQNTNTQAAIDDVTLTLLPRGGGTPIVISGQTILAGTSKTWQLDNTTVWGDLPDTALDLGARGFMGSMIIESATPLVVQSFIDIDNVAAISAFSGIPATSADVKGYCPLVRDNYYGNTAILIVNNNDGPASVDITFRPDPKSPNIVQVSQNIQIPANSSNIAAQIPGGNTRDAGMPGGTQSTSNTLLTNNGWFGSAELTSDLPIVASVQDSLFGLNYAVEGQSSYNCVPPSGASTTHFAPLLRRFHLEPEQLVSGVQVINLTGSDNTASLALANWDGTDAPDMPDQVMGPNGATNFYLGDATGLPTVPQDKGGYGWFGSGVLTCTGDCIALVTDEHVAGFGTKTIDRANYIALPQ